jgi:eukaryotic-like serine/threonine-protein kinase
MSVVRFFLEDAERPSPAAISAGKGSRRRTAGLLAVSALVAAAISGLATWLLVRAPMTPAGGTARFAVLSSPSQLVGIGGPDRAVVIAGDGRHIVSINGSAMGGGGQLLVRPIDQLEPVPLRGLANVRAPFISADGRWIGFFETGELKKVPMAGGPAITICRVTGGTRGSSWGADGTIVFATNDANTGLFSVPAAGGEPKLLTKPDPSQGELDHVFPEILPDGTSVLFTVTKAGGLDSAEIDVLNLKTGRRTTVIRGGTSPAYVRVPARSQQSGYLLYASGGALRAVAFDLARLEPTGDPTVVVDQVRVEGTGAAQFSVSRDGTLVYASGGSRSFEARSLVWVDRRGVEQPIAAPTRTYAVPRVSPDGTRAALALTDQEQDIWILEFAHATLSRLTFGPSQEQNPVWMPDGRRILFMSNRVGIPNVFWQPADNTGAAEPLTSSQMVVAPYSVVPDGKALVVSVAGTDLGVVRMDRPKEILPLIDDNGAQSNAEISPNGQWIAYQSNESGLFQIYVRPFPDVKAGKWQITTDTGTRPVWARNGRELFYLAGREGAVTSVPIQTTPTFTYGKATKLFEGRYWNAAPSRSFDVSPDGQKFLMIKETETSNATPASTVIVLNWIEELKQRLPTK